MAPLKTHATDDDVAGFIARIEDPTRRAECAILLERMTRATGETPVVWNSGIVGFGTFHYRSGSGQEGDWFPVGFASRKAALTLYLGMGLDPVVDRLARLGPHTTGRGCVYVKRLADVDLDVLEALVAASHAHIRATYG